MKIIIIIIVIIIAVSLVINQTKNIIVNLLITSTARAATGLDVSIRKIDASIVKTAVNIDGILIVNSKNFTDRIMANIANIYIKMDLPALLKHKIHIQNLRLDLTKFFIIKDSNGKVNLDSLNFMKKEPAIFGKKIKKEKRPFDFSIDRLQLSIGNVIYKDYTAVPLKVVEFDIGIKDEVYENVTDLNAIAGIVVARALAKTNLADIIGYNLADIHRKALATIQKGSEFLKQTTAVATGIVKGSMEQTKEAVGKAKEAIEGLFKSK